LSFDEIDKENQSKIYHTFSVDNDDNQSKEFNFESHRETLEESKDSTNDENTSPNLQWHPINLLNIRTRSNTHTKAQKPLKKKNLKPFNNKLHPPIPKASTTITTRNPKNSDHRNPKNSDYRNPKSRVLISHCKSVKLDKSHVKSGNSGVEGESGIEKLKKRNRRLRQQNKMSRIRWLWGIWGLVFGEGGMCDGLGEWIMLERWSRGCCEFLDFEILRFGTWIWCWFGILKWYFLVQRESKLVNSENIRLLNELKHLKIQMSKLSAKSEQSKMSTHRSAKRKKSKTVEDTKVMTILNLIQTTHQRKKVLNNPI